ncbi:MAG: serine/threonine-protein kinase [bacterium]
MSEFSLTGFTLIEKIGEGGMGQVWKARQLSLDRLVAIKLLPARLSHDPECIQQILQEARTAAKLKHSGIVHIYDASEQNGISFLVMEFVDGYNVGQWILRKKNLSYKDALVVTEHVALALQYAWRTAGLIHCDIKPENIMVDQDGSIKVADLGLSLTKDTKASPQAPNEVTGTPGYISPEQVMGMTPLDCRTDIYALGCCLYQMVTGVRPFKQLPDSEAMDAQVTSQIPDPRDIIPDLPGSVCALIERMLVKDRDHRLKDWDVVVKEVHRIRKGWMPSTEMPAEGASTMRRRKVENAGSEEKDHGSKPPAASRPSPFWMLGAVISAFAVAGLWWLFQAPVSVKHSPVKFLPQAGVTNASVPAGERVHVVNKPLNYGREIARENDQIKRTADKYCAEGNLTEGILWLENYTGRWSSETFSNRLTLAKSLKQLKAARDESEQAAACWKGFESNVTSCVFLGKYSAAHQIADAALADEKLGPHRDEVTAIHHILEDTGSLNDKVLQTFSTNVGNNVTLRLVRGTPLTGRLLGIRDRKLVVQTLDDAAQIYIRMEDLTPAERQARLFSLELPEVYLVRGVAAYNEGKAEEAGTLLARTDPALGALLIGRLQAEAAAVAATSQAAIAQAAAVKAAIDAAMQDDPAFIAFSGLMKMAGIEPGQYDFNVWKTAIESLRMSPETARLVDRNMNGYLVTYGNSPFSETNADLILTFQSLCGQALMRK